MPDRILAGQLPDATSVAYFKDFAPGTLWFAVIERGSDATGKTIGVEAWCTNLPQYVAYNLGGPDQHMPGGPWIAIQNPNAWLTPPSIDPTSKRQVPGKANIANFVIAKPQVYHFEIQAGEVRTHYDVQVGKPDSNQMGPMWDAEAIRDNTYMGRLERMGADLRDMARPTAVVGSSRSSGLKKVPKVP